MSLGEDHFDSVVVKNLSCLLVVELDIKFVVNFGEFFDPWDASKRIEISDFLNGISCALDLYSKVGMIPKFNNLSRLEAVFHGKGDGGGEGLELTDVPQCVSSTLECVEIQEILELEEGKMKATSYFLGNSAVLKKLILSPTAYDPRNVVESEIVDKVNKLTKRSTGCEIIIRAMKEEVVII
ncbi:hypothetical protein F2Q70_00041767 [Brassica cretica]|uniref:FBD domain-containing protein n=2 Tax=Brassica cretica TaxID=69181 RepID=A0A8S9MHH2_BRACR|nr:hypothetical protein F2Q70_00041767 [Brassica cretica]KAF2617947.1 hypothetical protein F2Q68_00042423 [Brassica cretica]KAF3498755.1 hypothetical protein DY000_02057772 [Brassica cretica]